MSFNKLRRQLRVMFIVHILVTVVFAVASFVQPFVAGAAVCNLVLLVYNYIRFKRQISGGESTVFGRNWVIWSRSAASIEDYNKREDIQSWCAENFGKENFQQFGNLFIFKDKRLLTQTKLMWGKDVSVV